MYSNPCAHRVRAFVGSSNRTVYSRISICTHGSIHICHRRGATGRDTARHATHTLALVPAFLSINSILFILEKLYATTATVLSWSAYNRPLLSYLVPITRDRLILTPFARRLDDFLDYRCNPLSEMIENIRTNNSEYFERRFKVAASRGED